MHGAISGEMDRLQAQLDAEAERFRSQDDVGHRPADK
jgi:hypothetical protein